MIMSNNHSRCNYSPALAYLIFAAAAALGGCSEATEQQTNMVHSGQPAAVDTVLTPDGAGNPFFEDWDTPYGIPPFDRILDEHYKPAFEKAIAEQQADIEAIRSNPSPPTFENTLEALELAGASLKRVSGVFSNITNTDTNDELQELEVEISPVLTREKDAIYLDETIFQRIQILHEQAESLGLDEEQARLLELTRRDFVRRGAALDNPSKERMRDINARLSELNTIFAQNLLKETKGFELVVTDEAELSGLPQQQIGSARKKAESKERPGAWVFGLDRATFESFMTFADNRELRRRMFDGYRSRGGQGGDHDNRDVLSEIANLRAERAELLGYANHAEYQLETRMAKTPAMAENFLLDVWNPGLERAREELAEMQLIVEDQGYDFIIEGWDWWYYAEKLRQKKYALDESEIKPYFELQNVRKGLFHVAGRLFGVTFEPLEDVPLWNPVVQPYAVHGSEGEFLGVYMADYYARDSKRGGAWMSTYRDASNIQGSGVRPIVTNNLNLSIPAEGEPTLLNFSQVETMFHEFGHGLHGLMTTVRYPRFAGTSGSPRDFVEFPSQFMEHYASEPEVLAVYARHAETGEVIPQELVEKVRASTRHNQGFMTTEFIAASLLDLNWHKLSAKQASAVEDTTLFESQVLDSYGKPAEIGPRYRSPYFAHIFAGGYSAGYYAYLWSEILDADGFTAFKETGDIYDPELAFRLKKNVYQAGGRRDADILYRDFRGEDPSIEPLLEIRGLN
jgi:peptidyl-dipeptidase Dcp